MKYLILNKNILRKLPIILFIFLITGCGCEKEISLSDENKLELPEIEILKIASSDIGFNTINVDVNGDENNTMSIGSKTNILTTVLPANTDEKYKIISDNNAIVEVYDTYYIKAKKVGKTRIYAIDEDNEHKSNIINIEVVE